MILTTNDPRARESTAPDGQAALRDEPRRLLRPNDAEYEAAHGMEPLADIHAERNPIADEFAALKPLHGPAKLWEHKRKALLSLLKVELRREWATADATQGMKMTEDAVDALAHIDPRYTAFLDDGVAGAVRYETLAVQMGNLEERSQRGQAIARLRASEAHMTPGGA